MVYLRFLALICFSLSFPETPIRYQGCQVLDLVPGRNIHPHERNIWNWIPSSSIIAEIRISPWEEVPEQRSVHFGRSTSQILSAKQVGGNGGELNITMTSSWARWCLKSPAWRLLTQRFIQAQIKENTKAPRHWHSCGEFTGGRWITRTKGQ